MRVATLLVLTAAIATGCSASRRSTIDSDPEAMPGSGVAVLHIDEVQWTPLNPARGDQSPSAGTLWGDRSGKGPTGFLVKFPKGFSSPPHIHNVTYRGVVMSGLVHNDDPDAAEMWMPPGSYWTQPKGEAHITAANGDVNVAYIEIGEGPYLVQPTQGAFDSGERPVNLVAPNIVWLDASNTRWIASARSNGPQIAHLWGAPQDDQLNGSLLKLPARYRGEIQTHGSSFRAVIIQGNVTLNDSEELSVGSSMSSHGRAVHRLTSGPDQESLVYIRSSGAYKLVPSE